MTSGGDTQRRGGSSVPQTQKAGEPGPENGPILPLWVLLTQYLAGLSLVGGDHDGEKFEVLGWEERFIRGAFGSEGDAALSLARGNGKSALVAALACGVVDPDGPLHGRRREVVCVASSLRARAGSYSRTALRRWSISTTHCRGRYGAYRTAANSATIEHRPSGARIRCIGSDPKRAHGLRPALALLDEPAQWERAKADAMLAAIRTGLGKVPNSKLIALGTRPVGPDHWFARMLREADYRQVHAAADDAPPFQKRTIRRANPSYDHLPSLRGRLEKELRDAKRDSGLLASWRSLRLNQGTGDTVEAYLVDASTWREAEGDAPQGDWCVWGVDLGTGAAMSAVAAYWPGTGRLETFAAFPERPSLYQRGHRRWSRRPVHHDVEEQTNSFFSASELFQCPNC